MLFDNSNRLRDAAVKVASGFLARNEGLTDGVVKVAQEQLLNADQARRVCERANHLVHAAMRKQASTVEFDVADPAEVARRLGASERVATHYFAPAGGTEKTASEVDPQDAVFEREAAHEALVDAEHRRLKLSELREGEVMAQDAYEHAQERFFGEMLKLAADGGDMGEAMEAFAEYAPLAAQPDAMLCVARLVKAAHLTRYERRLSFTPRTLEILHNPDELEKVASEVDPDLVNPGLQISGSPVTFIRGKHAVWTSIDTLLHAYCTALCAHDAVARAQLSPDHTRPAPRRRVSVTHGMSGREYSVAGRTI